MTRRKKRSFDKARKTKKKSDIARYRKLKSATQKECRKAYCAVNPRLAKSE
jgi:hypothetical protein